MSNENEITKTPAEINAEKLAKANEIYTMLTEAGYTPEDLAITDFLINPHKHHHPMPPCPPPKPPCPPPPPPRCDVAEFTAPKPIVHPHAPHKDHDHNMPPCPPPPVKPLPFFPEPCPPLKPPCGPFPPYAPNNCGPRPPMPNPVMVAQADWDEKNPFCASYILNKPNVALSINGIKPDKDGNVKLDNNSLGMRPMSKSEIVALVNQVYPIFDVTTTDCDCNCCN